MYIQQLWGMILPPSQNTVGLSNQITLLILYCVISRLVTLLKIIDTSLHVSDIFLSYC